MKVPIVTDAWEPQTNGVVTTLKNVIAGPVSLGHQVDVIEPRLFPTVALPSYPEIRVAATPWRIGPMIDASRADAVHIATEGPLGWAARRHLVRQGSAFTTSLHTKLPEYVQHRTGLPAALGYSIMRRFHSPATHTLVTTDSHKRELEAWGLGNLVVWGRGVDTHQFRPDVGSECERPRLLYVGRIAVEKNIDAFLSLDMDADKVVVGDGPLRKVLQRRYPEVAWRGYRFGQELVDHYADADVFVFPSLTDTFGLVMLEAMACGTSVAAYPVTEPRDVVIETVNGALDHDSGKALQPALAVPRAACRRFTLGNDWRVVAKRMEESLELTRLPPLAVSAWHPADCLPPHSPTVTSASDDSCATTRFVHAVPNSSG